MYTRSPFFPPPLFLNVFYLVPNRAISIIAGWSAKEAVVEADHEKALKQVTKSFKKKNKRLFKSRKEWLLVKGTRTLPSTN